MAWQQVLALLLLVGCSAQVAQSFYLPGVAPQDFKKGDAIYLKVNKVSLAHIHACRGQEPCDRCQQSQVTLQQQHALPETCSGRVPTA